MTSLIETHPMLILVGVLCLTVSVLLMQFSTKVLSIKRPTLPAIFFVTYLIMIYFPAFFVYRDRPGPFRDSYIIGVMLTTLAVPIGIIAANYFLRFRYFETEKYFSGPIIEPKYLGGMFIVHAVVTTACLVVFVHYLMKTPVIPVIELMKPDRNPETLVLAREESLKLLDPAMHGPNATNWYYGYLFLRTLLFPFVVLTLIGYALFTKQLRWIVLASVVFLVTSFYAVSTLARAPISAVIMRIFFFLYLFYGGRTNKKLVASCVALMIAFPLIVTTYAYSTTRTLFDGLVSLAIRMTYSPALDLFYYFEIFPAKVGYLHGQTLLKPFQKLLGWDYFYIENYVHLYISPHGVKSGHSNAAFTSNLYADFGLVGVVIGSILCGAAMQAVHIYLSRSKKSILYIALYSFMIYAIWVLNFGSITSVLFVNGVVPVILLAIGMHHAATHLSKLCGRESAEG